MEETDVGFSHAETQRTQRSSSSCCIVERDDATRGGSDQETESWAGAGRAWSDVHAESLRGKFAGGLGTGAVGGRYLPLEGIICDGGNDDT